MRCGALSGEREDSPRIPTGQPKPHPQSQDSGRKKKTREKREGEKKKRRKSDKDEDKKKLRIKCAIKIRAYFVVVLVRVETDGPKTRGGQSQAKKRGDPHVPVPTQLESSDPAEDVWPDDRPPPREEELIEPGQMTRSNDRRTCTASLLINLTK